MRYISTRDTNQPPRYFSFIDAVLEGLAPDGGLLVPEYFPSVSAEEWTEWKSLSYTALCAVVLRKFISEDEIPNEDLHRMIDAAYSSAAGWRDSRICPLNPIDLKSHIQVLELFHGPTYAFKDVALQLLGQFFDYALKKRNARMTILGATSGDTGSAAIAGVKGRSNIDCVILFPLGKTSKIQELQMTSNLEPNIHCLAVTDSVFDDCQSIVKSCFSDEKFNQEMSLGAVNSINWSRILAQVVYYVYAAARIDNPVSFVVPTGNFGNMLAGYYARKLGNVIPIKSLVIASNSNDILPNFFECGNYTVSGHVVPTMSPSMDIAVSSNFERYLFDLWGRNPKTVVEKFSELKTVKSFSVNADQLETARSEFFSYAVDESNTLDTIAHVFENTGYLLCPHSAVGYKAAEEFEKSSNYDGEAIVTLATAHIGKFTETILGNMNEEGEFRKVIENSVPPGLAKLREPGIKVKRLDIENSIEAIKTYMRSHVNRE
jgi:threonine synthase